MRLNSLIVDDEVLARKVLSGLITEFCPAVTIVGMADSANSARHILETNKVDIIFLDVNMPNETGFDLLDSIDQAKYSVIFVTGNEEFALRALKASAADFLLKPVDIEELKLSIKKVTAFHEMRLLNKQLNGDYISSINTLTGTIRNKTQISRITLHHLQGFKIITIAEIIYLEADGNYTIFHMQNGEKIVVSKGMGEYEQLLNENTFIRTHKSFIINLFFLKEYSTIDGHFAIMEDGTNVIISRRRVDYFIEKVKQYNIT
jgi:two-component system, LytTR family, response regulator